MASHATVSRVLQFPTTKPRVRSTRTSGKGRWRESVPIDQEATSPVAGCGPKRTCEESDAPQRAVPVDSDALSALSARHKGKLYQSAFSVLRNKQDAEDALQDGLPSAHLHLASFEGKSQLSRWVIWIVINAALMNRRKLQKDLRRSAAAAGIAPSDDWPPGAVDHHPGPEQAYTLLELKNSMATQMSQLTPALQWAFHLRHVENFSVRKAASFAGVSVTAVKAPRFVRTSNSEVCSAPAASSPPRAGLSCLIVPAEQAGPTTFHSKRSNEDG